MTEYAHAKNIKPRPEVVDAVDTQASQAVAQQSEPFIVEPTGEDEERIARQSANGASTQGEQELAEAASNEGGSKESFFDRIKQLRLS